MLGAMRRRSVGRSLQTGMSVGVGAADKVMVSRTDALVFMPLFHEAPSWLVKVAVLFGPFTRSKAKSSVVALA